MGSNKTSRGGGATASPCARLRDAYHDCFNRCISFPTPPAPLPRALLKGRDSQTEIPRRVCSFFFRLFLAVVVTLTRKGFHLSSGGGIAGGIRRSSPRASGTKKSASPSGTNTEPASRYLLLPSFPIDPSATNLFVGLILICVSLILVIYDGMAILF